MMKKDRCKNRGIEGICNSCCESCDKYLEIYVPKEPVLDIPRRKWKTR